MVMENYFNIALVQIATVKMFVFLGFNCVGFKSSLSCFMINAFANVKDKVLSRLEDEIIAVPVC